MAGPAAFDRLGAEQDRQMVPLLALSALAHALLLAALFAWPVSGPRGFGLQVIPVELVPTSPMPRGGPDGDAAYVPPEPEKPEPAEPEPTEPARAPKPEPAPPRDEIPRPVDRPTRMQREKEKPDAPSGPTLEESIARLRQRMRDRKQIGDPEGVAGTQAAPGSGGMRERMVALYLAKLKRKVERNWIRPPGVPPGRKLEVGIRFQLDERGDVQNPRLTRRSGLLWADKSCMQALRKAAPFDRPSSTVLASLRREGGIELIFELTQ